MGNCELRDFKPPVSNCLTYKKRFTDICTTPPIRRGCLLPQKYVFGILYMYLLIIYNAMSIHKTLSAKASSVLALGMLGLALFAPAIASAQGDPATDFGLTDAQQINVSGSQTDPKIVIANVINIALGFLGILAVILIIYAGFKWMTAGGNDDQVGEARKMILQAVIGLVIIFLAYVITNFVVTRLSEAV